MLSQLSFTVGLIQYAVAVTLLVSALFGFHYFLPAARQRVNEVFWGIVITIIGIIVGSKVFAFYLQTFSDYASLYAGLAGVMIVIVYLYYMSVLILFGAEFNAALSRHRTGKFASLNNNNNQP